MKITKAVVTAASPGQRNLPLQTLIDRDGEEKSVLRIIIEEIIRAGVEEICVVTRPGDEAAYLETAGDHRGRLHIAHQDRPLGHGHAVHCARSFTGTDPFLHAVGDHLYVSRTERGCAQHLVDVAEAEASAVSAVQATRESMLPYYGAVGARRVQGRNDLFEVKTVIEKPTPTQAEQKLIVPGLRAGHYLCFFGMHVLTPGVQDILGHLVRESGDRGGVTLAAALAELARHEQYLALEQQDWRYDIGVRYGLLTAQLALALNGQDRDEVLNTLLRFLAAREMNATGRV